MTFLALTLISKISGTDCKSIIFFVLPQGGNASACTIFKNVKPYAEGIPSGQDFG